MSSELPKIELRKIGTVRALCVGDPHVKPENLAEIDILI